MSRALWVRHVASASSYETCCSPLMMRTSLRWGFVPPPSAFCSKSSGLGIDYFGGLQDSALDFMDVQRWRYLCTNPSDALSFGLSYPRPNSIPGANTIRLVQECVRGTCYNNSLLYIDFGE